MTLQLNLDIHRELKSLIHCAKVYLAQSRHFTRRARGFSFVLLGWAANCRRKIASATPEVAQLDLFADIAIERMAA